MDWTKAKTLLIVALLVTNLLLVFMFVMNERENDNEARQVYAETLKLMEDRNIRLADGVELENSNKLLAVLKVNPIEFDQQMVRELLDRQEGMIEDEGSEEDITTYVEKFFKENDLLKSTMVFDKIVYNEEYILVKYKNIYENIPIEDSYVVCTIKDQIIEEMDYQWLEPESKGDKKKPTINAVNAMISFMSERPDEDEILINEVKLIYWRNPYYISAQGTVSDTALPTWKITYNDDKVMHITAYNNQ